MLFWPLLDRQWGPPALPRKPRHYLAWIALSGAILGLLHLLPALQGLALSTLALAFISNAGTTPTESVLDRAAPAASAPAESGGQIPTAPTVLGSQPAPVQPVLPAAPTGGAIPKQ